MTNFMARMAALAGLLVAGLVPTAQAGEPPVAVLMQVTGTVELSHDGNTWKPVTRNKFLFAGEVVRTGADGAAKVVDEAANTARALGPNSRIEVAANAVTATAGTLAPPEQLAGDLAAGLSTRFAEAQRYTTVRRGVHTEAPKLHVARQVTLSATYPDLVWQNLGKDLSYTLVVDGNSLPVPPAGGDMVRFRVPTLTPGSHSFTVQALEPGKAPRPAENEGTIVWLSPAEDAALADGLAKVKATAPNDTFAQANFLDSKGLTVAALDLYRKYFADNQDDNDMRPLLIRAYFELKLNDLRQKEATLYNDMVGTN